MIVLANHKGGVTKTTSTANLGAMLAEAGRRVLIVDCDPQANLSEAFGWYADLPGERLEDLLAHPDAADRYAPPLALQPDVVPELPWRERLRIIPSHRRARRRRRGPPRHGRTRAMSCACERCSNRCASSFDLILLDTPPGLGTLSGMAVLAADGLLIPALAADLDVRGAGKLYDLVEGEVPGLRILGRADRRERAALADHPRRSCSGWTRTRCACCRCMYRAPSAWRRRRATALRPPCWSPTRWSATPTASSPSHLLRELGL